MSSEIKRNENFARRHTIEPEKNLFTHRFTYEFPLPFFGLDVFVCGCLFCVSVCCAFFPLPNFDAIAYGSCENWADVVVPMITCETHKNRRAKRDGGWVPEGLLIYLSFCFTFPFSPNGKQLRPREVSIFFHSAVSFFLYCFPTLFNPLIENAIPKSEKMKIKSEYIPHPPERRLHHTDRKSVV